MKKILKESVAVILAVTFVLAIPSTAMACTIDEEGRQKAADEFFVLCDRYGITEYAEVNSSIEDYKNGRMDEAVAQIHAEMEKDARNEKLLKGFLAGGLIGLAIAGIVIGADK